MLVLALVPAAAVVVCFVSYLLFLAFVVVRSGTEGLRDVAVAIRAFHGIFRRR